MGPNSRRKQMSQSITTADTFRRLGMISKNVNNRDPITCKTNVQHHKKQQFMRKLRQEKHIEHFKNKRPNSTEMCDPIMRKTTSRTTYPNRTRSSHWKHISSGWVLPPLLALISIIPCSICSRWLWFQLVFFFRGFTPIPAINRTLPYTYKLYTYIYI